MTISTEELNGAAEAIAGRRGEQATAALKKYQPFNAQLREEAISYCERNQLPRAELARQVGYGTTQVIKYLNGKPDWNVAKFEDSLRDVIRTAEKRKLLNQDLFPTPVTQQVNAICEQIRRSNAFSLIHGAAGWGKTCGMRLYLSSFPSAVGLTVTKWNRGATDQVRLLWESAGGGSWGNHRGDTRANALVKKFEGTHRLIIVDNAHRLTLGGLHFWFDFYDTTGCPIAFLGNPEILELIEPSDQMGSRLKPIHMVEMKESAFQTIAQRMIHQILGEQVEELEDLAEAAIGSRGHLRTLRQQLSLAKDIRDANDKTDWRSAWRMAGTKLVRQEAKTMEEVRKR